jgi:pullulanase
MNRLAAAIVLTSQGISFIHAGEELARSKGGDENSYRSPDSVNQLRWEHKTERRDLFEYYQGLIALRKAFPAFRMTTAEQIRERIEFLNTEAQIVAYTIQDEKPILVAFNADRNDRELMLPESGSWLIYVNGEKAGKEALGRVGGESMVLAGRSAYVLVYEGAEWVGAVGDEAASEQETAAEGVSGVLGAEPARPIWLYGLVMFFAGLVTGILGVFGGIKIVRYRSRKKEVTS